MDVDLERLCCSFFDFVIEVERDGGPVWLRMTDGDEANGIPRAGLERCVETLQYSSIRSPSASGYPR